MARLDVNQDLQKHQVDEVKRNLPDVMVELGGKTMPAHTFGREKPFATVVPVNMPDSRHEVSWAAVTRSVVYHTVIVLD